MTKEFYEKAFDGVLVPMDIKDAAIEICETFGIKGSADPMYISNVIAKETGTGDGYESFNGKSHDTSKLQVVSDRLADAYSTCIKDSGEKPSKVLDILKRQLR